MVLCNQSEIALDEKRPPTVFFSFLLWLILLSMRACVCVLISISEETPDAYFLFLRDVNMKLFSAFIVVDDAIKLMQNLGDYFQIRNKMKMRKLELMNEPSKCRRLRLQYILDDGRLEFHIGI